MSKICIPTDSIFGTIGCNYNRYFRRLDGKYIHHDSIPHLVHIEMTYACNTSCLGCYNPTRSKLGDLAIIDEVVRAVANSQIPHVYLIGGEPSLVSEAKLNWYIELLAPHSSVTIVTNGIKCLRSISSKLACFGVPLHGDNAITHEFFNRYPGSFQIAQETIRYYANQGHDVRCIPVLTGYNHDQIYNICKLAAKLGMESVFVDRFEDGGIGASFSGEYQLKPTLQQFQIAVGQMLKAREDFQELGGRIGFGTAVPFCLDERMILAGMTADCGVGSSFVAINPAGEVRMCNQSQLSFGNVLKEPLEIIWNKPAMDIFRDLSWVDEPCASCELLLECTGGCKVDTNRSDKFCIDYSVRKMPGLVPGMAEKLRGCELMVDYPLAYRRIKPNRYAKLILKHPEKFLVNRYQTIKLDEAALLIMQGILKETVLDENDLVQRFEAMVEETEVRLFVSRLLQVQAVDLLGEVENG